MIKFQQFFEGKKAMKITDSDPYLGFVISNNGTNMKNIQIKSCEDLAILAIFDDFWQL